MYEPIRPVKNMISVDRNSHIATLPGVIGGGWTPVVAAGVTWSASAVSVGMVACAMARTTLGITLWVSFGSGRRNSTRIRSSRHRVQQEQEQDRGQIHER